MDIWNNTEGRKVVNEFFDYLIESKIDINSLSETQVEDILAQRINQKIRNRELITNPLDPRILKKYSHNTNRVCQRMLRRKNK